MARLHTPHFIRRFVTSTPPATLLAVAGLLSAAACGEPREAAQARLALSLAPASAAPSLPPGITVDRRITLRESAEVINVAPEAVVDPAGGFLVSDEREAQIRRYAIDGTLLWHAGRRGGGPGEFNAPTAVVRLPSSEVAAFDRGGRLTLFDADGRRVLRSFETPLRHVSDAAVLGDGSVLVAAIVEGDWDAPRLHRVDPATGRVQIGAIPFAPYPRSPFPVAAMFAGWTKLSVRGDTVAAIFATSDTVYLFTAAGRPLRTVPIPFARFRHPPRKVPETANADPRARVGWLASFDLVADVHWLANGDLVVPWQNFDAVDGTSRHWHLLRMTAEGRPVMEWREVPRLLEVDAARSAIYFVDPGAEAPNQWLQAHLRG